MITRDRLEAIYEEETGLNAQSGAARIDVMEKAVKEHELNEGDFTLVNDPDEINYGWQEGRKWWQGAQIDNKILLGYTNKGTRRDNCRNAIFMVLS